MAKLFRVLKVILYFVIIALIALLAFAYLGPLFGVDFSPPQTKFEIPLELTAE